MSDLFSVTYNPDVLSCLANLSNDEVFTPPEVVNQMLDMLPEEIWSDKNATFLDPACKSGVFLREIAKRLINAQLPNYEQISYEINDKLRAGCELDGRDIAFQNMLEGVIEHVFKNQVFGIAITELTSLLSRRSVYCSKYPQSEYSVVRFDNPEGRIDYKQMQHTWKNGKCIYCGASKGEYDREESKEQYAYEFIHLDNPEEVFDMKFDVIIGNPPYHMSDGGNKNSAMPIYQKFIEQANRLKPKYLCMIVPSRWYCGGRGLESFRQSMLNEGHLRILHDFKAASDCFPGIRNGGGICYFLLDNTKKTSSCEIVEHEGNSIKCITTRKLNEFGDFFIRDSTVCEILRKVSAHNEAKLADTVYSQKPFGFRTNFTNFDETGDIKIYTKKKKEGFAYIKQEKVEQNQNLIPLWKVVTSRSTSVPEEDNGQVLRLSQTFIAEPNSVVTESYVLLAAFSDKTEADNFYSYLKTKFFRFLCQPLIVSPDVSKRTFLLVPIQNYSKSWTDEELFNKYGLSPDECKYIEDHIRSAEQED